MKISYVSYAEYLFKKWTWVAIEYLLYGFFVASGAIIALKLFY